MGPSVSRGRINVCEERSGCLASRLCSNNLLATERGASVLGEGGDKRNGEAKRR